MKRDDLKQLFLDITAVEIGKNENIASPLKQFFKASAIFFKSQKGPKLKPEMKAFGRTIQDPGCYFFGIQINAEKRLKELGFPEKIWKELTPQFASWQFEFTASDTLTKKLGVRGCHADQLWTARDAAELAAAAHFSMLIKDPQSVFALGEFIGTLVSPKQRLALKEMQQTVMKQLATRTRPNARGKIKSPLKQLVVCMREAQKNLTAKGAIEEFRKSAKQIPTPKMEVALTKLPLLNIKIQEVVEEHHWRDGKIYFIANGKEQSIQFKKIRDWLPGHKRQVTLQSHLTSL